MPKLSCPYFGCPNTRLLGCSHLLRWYVGEAPHFKLQWAVVHFAQCHFSGSNMSATCIYAVEQLESRARAMSVCCINLWFLAISGIH